MIDFTGKLECDHGKVVSTSQGHDGALIHHGSAVKNVRYSVNLNTGEPLNSGLDKSWTVRNVETSRHKALRVARQAAKDSQSPIFPLDSVIDALIKEGLIVDERID